jgi:hypothetical protein
VKPEKGLRNPGAAGKVHPVSPNQVVGKTFLFECPRCAYRAYVSGRTDRGLGVCVETIVCRDCKRLYDVVVRMRPPKEQEMSVPSPPSSQLRPVRSADKAPPANQALNRLQMGLSPTKWVEFKKRCPVSSLHRIQEWSDPEKCPQCGNYLERHGLPQRIWD